VENCMKVDRKNRDRLIDAINGYLAGIITEDEFEDEAFNVEMDTRDRTIIHVAEAAQNYMEDLNDPSFEKISKEVWDQFQRFTLILTSDANIKYSYKMRWSHLQSFAACELGLFILSLAIFGLNGLLIVSYFVLFTRSVLIHKKHYNNLPLPIEFEEAITPFSSVSEMAKVYKSTNTFIKQKRPEKFKSRQSLNLIVGKHITYALWFLFAPFALFFQMFPSTVETSRVELPS
jgi:hypothetical protein